ncbi:hypothetical protein [Streptomyces malaysiensis]|nr:hypothetical protein [Streptomyces malaysiensis]
MVIDLNCIMVLPKIAPLPARMPAADAAQSTLGRESSSRSGTSRH